MHEKKKGRKKSAHHKSHFHIIEISNSENCLFSLNLLLVFVSFFVNFHSRCAVLANVWRSHLHRLLKSANAVYQNVGRDRSFCYIFVHRNFTVALAAQNEQKQRIERTAGDSVYQSVICSMPGMHRQHIHLWSQYSIDLHSSRERNFTLWNRIILHINCRRAHFMLLRHFAFTNSHDRPMPIANRFNFSHSLSITLCQEHTLN